MNGQRWQRVKQLLEEAIALEEGERTSFLDRGCDGDLELRREVESLLASHKQAGAGFLNHPAVNVKTLVEVQPRDATRAGRRAGVYEIVEQIGHGGMGEVYRAVRADGQYTKEVAVKLVRGGGDSRQVVERFLNERQILASLDHPNIARLLDGGTTDDGVPYLVMELIEGASIDSYCDEHKLSITERLQLFRQVCGAVQYAHQRLVIHRDIKPSNVLVTGEGVPKLLDFGIAKIVSPAHDAQTTLTQAMTPEYASPEQIRGEPITTASDVYSLGVVLYQLLTGRSPYPGDTRTPHKLAQAVCETQPGRPSTVVVKRDPTSREGTNPERISSIREGSPAKLQRRLAGDLDDITMMALRKEAARRYSSVEQFAEDIGRHLEGRPVAASKGSRWYRTEKFVKRHKVGITAVAVVVLAVAGGVGAVIREARIAHANALRAESGFNDVRHLANSLVFDVDKSIAELPGATPARKLLVDEALQYLDRLSQEAKGDVTLQRELAGAYLKLGDVQGNPFVPNLGDTAAALASYHKALAIREAIAAANPKNKEDQMALAYAHLGLGAIVLVANGNPQEALAEESKALNILEPLARDDPSNLEVLDQLRVVYETIGDIESGNGNSANLDDTDSALENHRKSLAISERILRGKADDLAARKNTAIAHLKVARDLVKKGDRTAALESYRKGLDILQLLGSSANPTLARYFSLVYQDVGNVQMMNGDSRGALLNYRKQMDIVQKLVERDPKNASARVDIAYATVFVGLATAESGDVRQGLALLERGIDPLEKEAELDPKKSFLQRYLSTAFLFRGQILFKSGELDGAWSDFNKAQEAIVSVTANDVDAQIALAGVNSKIADVMVMRGESDGGIGLYRKSLAVVEPFAHASHPLLPAQYTAADTYAGLGRAFQRQVHASIAQQMDSLKQACSWFEQSRAEWQRVPNPGRFSPTGFDTPGPSRAAQELSSCETGLKKLQERGKAARH